MQTSSSKTSRSPLRSGEGSEIAVQGAPIGQMIDSSLVRQFLAYLKHIDLSAEQLGFKEVETALKGASGSLPVSTRVIVEMLQRTAQVTQRSDIGVLFGEWLDRRDLSPVFLLVDHARSFAQQYRLYQKYMLTLSTSLLYSEVLEGNSVALILALHPTLHMQAAQFQEGHIAVIARVGRAILGDSWSPQRIEFAHPQPASTMTQRRFFRCPVQYDSERYAVVLSSDDYFRTISRGDKKTLTFIEDYLAGQTARWPADLCAQVERIVAAQLPQKGASVKRTAGLLAMSPSNLQRRLAARGTSFGDILVSVRINVVRDHLAQQASGPALARLAHKLGFSEPSAACRFIRTHFGVSAKSLLGD